MQCSKPFFFIPQNFGFLTKISSFLPNDSSFEITYFFRIWSGIWSPLAIYDRILLSTIIFLVISICLFLICCTCCLGSSLEHVLNIFREESHKKKSFALLKYKAEAQVSKEMKEIERQEKEKLEKEQIQQKEEIITNKRKSNSNLISTSTATAGAGMSLFVTQNSYYDQDPTELDLLTDNYSSLSILPKEIEEKVQEKMKNLLNNFAIDDNEYKNHNYLVMEKSSSNGESSSTSLLLIKTMDDLQGHERKKIQFAEIISKISNIFIILVSCIIFAISLFFDSVLGLYMFYYIIRIKKQDLWQFLWNQKVSLLIFNGFSALSTLFGFCCSIISIFFAFIYLAKKKKLGFYRVRFFLSFFVMTVIFSLFSGISLSGFAFFFG